MSKKSYSEEVRDLVIARDKFRDALLEALKPAIRAINWIFDRPRVLTIVLSFLCALLVTLMFIYR
jgi:hypothetical protein